MKIFYFTGTGNSLYIAKRLGGELISIPQAIEKRYAAYSDDVIGIVCPIYCHMPPVMVQDFLQKVSFQADYIFVIFTYGNRKCDAFEWMDSFMRNNSISCDYISAVKMVDNYLPSFDMKEQMGMDKHVEEQIEQIVTNVINRRTGYEKTTSEEKMHHKKIMKMAEEIPELFDGSLIHITDACTDCGRCAMVCPNGMYEYVDGKMFRKSGSCDYCQACAQCCPSRAIMPGKTDENPDARYINPNVNWKEIMKANNRQKHLREKMNF